ncbi:hypothetical protein Tco_0237140 [Tanacetum coccineum]
MGYQKSPTSSSNNHKKKVVVGDAGSYGGSKSIGSAGGSGGITVMSNEFNMYYWSVLSFNPFACDLVNSGSGFASFCDGCALEKIEGCSKFIMDVSNHHGSNYSSTNKRRYSSVPGSPSGVVDAYFSSENSSNSWAFASSVTSSPEPPFKKNRARHGTHAPTKKRIRDSDTLSSRLKELLQNAKETCCLDCGSDSEAENGSDNVWQPGLWFRDGLDNGMVVDEGEQDFTNLADRHMFGLEDDQASLKLKDSNDETDAEALQAIYINSCLCRLWLRLLFLSGDSSKGNFKDTIEIDVDVIHPVPVSSVVFPAATVVMTLAQHEEAIWGIQEHLLGVPIQEELTNLRFRVDVVEAENASLRATIRTMEAIETVIATPTIPVVDDSSEGNFRDTVDIGVDVIHPVPVALVVFPATTVVTTLALHGEAIQGIHEHLLGVPIHEELTALRFRVDIVEAENASLCATIRTMEAVETVTRNHERLARIEIERQLASVQESHRQDREDFKKLKELVTSQFGHRS